MNEQTRGALVSHALALLAVDPFDLGGAVLRGPHDPMREAWCDALRAALPYGTPWRRMPPRIDDGALLGGLDLAATLAAGRPVAERGLLTAASGGVLTVPMAERLARSTVGHLAAALDSGEVVVERDGLARRAPARFTAILFDEGLDEEQVSEALIDRLAFVVDLGASRAVAPDGLSSDCAAVAAARRRLPEIEVSPAAIEALCAAGMALGAPSLRVANLALRAAKAAAALAGRGAVGPDDLELAAALVIAPRATRVPGSDADDDEAAPAQPEAEPDAPDETGAGEQRILADSVVEAAVAAIPPGLLAALGRSGAAARRSAGAGRAGQVRQSVRRGRPAGVRRGLPGRGARLALVETLRAAAPWQRLRSKAPSPTPGSIQVRRDDLRIQRFKEHNESVAIFVVDASGSAAAHRLAEVKGAVELILAECYVRRDSVALIAFRRDRAEIILPPTRSLARAKRALAGQPGGGGTPLATAIDSASLLAAAVRRKGQVPLVVVLTDGRANIDRAGRAGRATAEADATAAAQAFRMGGVAGLVLDIAPRPADAAARLATTMGVRYIPLPYADASAVARVVLASAPARNM